MAYHFVAFMQNKQNSNEKMFPLLHCTSSGNIHRILEVQFCLSKKIEESRRTESLEDIISAPNSAIMFCRYLLEWLSCHLHTNYTSKNFVCSHIFLMFAI